MIETANYGRLSEGLLIYQIAMQRFIARTLRTANNGAGDWFRDLVLTSLGGSRRENLERNLAETDDGSSPEQLLDASHFPHVIGENWSLFRQTLKDRDQVLRETREIRRWRPFWAHPSEKVTSGLSDSEVDEKLQTCKAVVERFDAEAAKLIQQLRSRNQEDASPTTSIPAPEDEPGAPAVVADAVDARENALRDEVERWRREREQNLNRLRERVRLYQRAAAEKAALSKAETALRAAGSELADLVEDEWGYAHAYQWGDCLADLLRATFDAGYPQGHSVEDDATGSGTIQFDVSETDLEFDIEIKIEIRDP